jgi:hypothetical protein
MRVERIAFLEEMYAQWNLMGADILERVYARGRLRRGGGLALWKGWKTVAEV